MGKEKQTKYVIAFGSPLEMSKVKKIPREFPSIYSAIRYFDNFVVLSKDLLETMFFENNKDNCIFLLRENEVISYFYKSVYIENDEIYHSDSLVRKKNNKGDKEDSLRVFGLQGTGGKIALARTK